VPSLRPCPVCARHIRSGEANAARWLSKRRAELARERLIKLGIDRRRIKVDVHGASPLPATSPAAADRDRRVSFVFRTSGDDTNRSCDESDRRKP
jgi:hypothetical protein